MYGAKGFWRLRHEDLEADVPLGALAGLERDHAGIDLSPLLAEGVAEVVLVLDGDELRGGGAYIWMALI